MVHVIVSTQDIKAMTSQYVSHVTLHVYCVTSCVTDNYDVCAPWNFQQNSQKNGKCLRPKAVGKC